MKHICLRIFSISLLITVIFIMMGLFNPVAYASVSGGAGTILLSPRTGNLPIGQNTPIDILFNTTNVPISGIQVVLKFTVTNPVDLAATIQTNSSLADAGWSFPVKTVTTSGSEVTIELMGLNVSNGGYATNTNTKLATITFAAARTFTNKVLSFDAGQTKMLKKSDATDFAGTPTNGSYSTSGTAADPTPTPTATPIPTPTPTPTTTQQSGGNTAPTCTGLTVNPSSGAMPSVVVTLTCTGTDPGGNITAASFDFGDGTSNTVSQSVGGTGSISTTHTYRQIGTVAAVCHVRDNDQVFSAATDACKKLITMRSATSGGTTQPVVTIPTATPTPIATTVVTPTEEITPIPVYESPTPTLEPEPPATSSGPSWWLIGTLGLIGIGGIIYFLSRKKRPPTAPPWMAPPTQQPYPPVAPPPPQPPPQPPIA